MKLKKYIVLNSKENDEGYYTFEEILKTFTPKMLNVSRKWRGVGEHEERMQILRLETWKAYKNYKVGVSFVHVLNIYYANRMKKTYRDRNIAKGKKESYVESINKDIGKDTEILDLIPENSQGFNKVENLILVEEIINSLNKEDKQLIIDYYFKEMYQSDMAKARGTNQMEISRELKRIRDDIKRRYKLSWRDF